MGVFVVWGTLIRCKKTCFLITQFGRKPKLPRGICSRLMNAKAYVMLFRWEPSALCSREQMPPFAWVCYAFFPRCGIIVLYLGTGHITM
jgi:hypothetical protein